MISNVLFVLIIICGILPLYQSKEMSRLNFETYIYKIKNQIQSLELIILDSQTEAQDTNIQWMQQIYHDAIMLGLPIVKTLILIETLLTSTKKFKRSLTSIIFAYSIKLTSMLLVAIIARIYLISVQNIPLSASDRQIDQAFLLIVLFFLLANFLILKKISPHHWFWNENLTPLAQKLIYSFLFKATDPTDPWYEKWQELENQEILCGYTLQKEKLQILKNWYAIEREKSLRKLTVTKNMLPLFELIFGVFSAILMIILPALNLIQN